MLTVKLQGGLGNQLFQIAAGEHISKVAQRRFYIENLNTSSVHSKEMYFDSIFKNWKNLYQPMESTMYNIPSFNYADFVPPSYFSNVCLNGYFQNWRFIDETFKSRLSFDESICQKYSKLQNAVFLHIRGGDYKNHWFHDVGLDSYYEKSILQFPKNTHFYIFTNDLEYALTKDFLKRIRHNFIFESEVNSLYLMSQCALGGICANSSFSWWGAYLNPNRKIIMPSKWYNDSNMYIDGYYFDGVVKIDV
jgi:hypothetical protein